MGKIAKISNLKKTLRYLKKNGIRRAYYAMKERIETETKSDYTYMPLSEEQKEWQRQDGKRFSTKFSILVPAFETRQEHLKAMLDSVLSQTYEHFELIIADASEGDKVEAVIRTYDDKRIMYRRLKQNAGISANTNQALMYATGDYAGLLDHDDVLTPDALYEMAACIAKHEEKDFQLQLLYSDEDKCDEDQSSYFEVNRKPEFNIDLLLTNNYVCHFMVMKRQLMQELGFRSVCDGAQDYDLVLRALNLMLGKDKMRTKKKEVPVAHISKVLYHWRCHADSTSENPASKQYAYDAGKRALEDFLRARGFKGAVSHLPHLGFYRIDYQPDLIANRPDVAVVGGRLVNRKNKIAGGVYTAVGQPIYEGLHKEYSGYMHRASLQQEVEMVDVRCMKVSLAAEAILEEMIGLPYLQHPGTGRFDWRDCLKEDVDFWDLSRRFCDKVREQGYRIVWDPAMSEKID